MRESDVEHALKVSLKNLQLEYIDLYLLHAPYGFENDGDEAFVPMNEDGSLKIDMTTNHETIWKSMEAQVDAGRAKSIGVSNFNESQISKMMKFCRIQPACNQVELHAKFRQKSLTEICMQNRIQMVAYAPIGSPGLAALFEQRGMPPTNLPNLLTDPVVTSIAASHNKTPAQVLLNHLMQSGVVVIPKSVKPGRIKENFAVNDFNLLDEEKSKLDELDAGVKGRTFVFSHVFKGIDKHPEYPFEY